LPQDIISGLEQDWFRHHTPAEIVTMVATVTLATISTWTEERLDYLGWTNNPIIEILYSMTSAGVWVARTNSLGYPQVADPTTDTWIVHATKAIMAQSGWVSGYTGSGFDERVKTWGIKEITLTNGASSNNVLTTAKASYFDVIQIVGIYSDASVDGNTIDLSFQDEDDTALAGAPATLTVPCVNTAISKDLEGVIMYATADNKDCEVDVDTGGGAGDDGKKVYLLYYHWKET
jgi:hypothetical protein